MDKLRAGTGNGIGGQNIMSITSDLQEIKDTQKQILESLGLPAPVSGKMSGMTLADYMSDSATLQDVHNRLDKLGVPGDDIEWRIDWMLSKIPRKFLNAD